jgi:nucleoside 2-deoxyribosyltransferase
MTMKVLIYIAGPLFSHAEREFLEKIVNTLARSARLDPLTNFFLPHRDGGELGKGPCRHDIFHLDVAKINSADAVVALLDGQDSDSGTCVELGYAYANHKKIFGLLTDFRSYRTSDREPHRPNLMVWGVCEEGRALFNDLNTLAVAFREFVGSKDRQNLVSEVKASGV